jgi:putative phosphoribosyl transferase
MRFRDRQDAGRQLARLLEGYRAEAPVVLALPRGGVPVAYEVAVALGAPLDVWVVRKVGAPAFPELGLGAVAEGGFVYLDRHTIEEVGATQSEVQALVRAKSAEVAERVRRLRGGHPALQLSGRTVILVDDGIATGGTVQAAVQALRAAHPRRIVLATPVAASQSLERLAPLVDAVACVFATPSLHAIGAWYDDFEQVPEEAVGRFLERARRRRSARTAGARSGAFEPKEALIPLRDAHLRGTLAGPPHPIGLVLFAHGSGSSRHSPRNQKVATALHGHGLATLLFDLLTAPEEATDALTGELRFDIERLAERLGVATNWALQQQTTAGLPLAYFGSSTGAAAALVAAAQRPAKVGAVVSRGGRPDLAWESLPLVRTPTLLIVGGEDRQVLELNRRAYQRLSAPRRLAVVEGAGHLFEEPGALAEVARLAGTWLAEHLRTGARFESWAQEQPPA